MHEALMQPEKEEHFSKINKKRKNNQPLQLCATSRCIYISMPHRLDKYAQDLIRVTFDIKEDGQLVFDAFLHCLLQSWDLLSNELVPGDNQSDNSVTEVNLR